MKNYDFLNITLFNSYLGVMNYLENVRQTSNDEIKEELQKQDKKYLEKILENQNEIISLLKKVVK